MTCDEERVVERRWRKECTRGIWSKVHYRGKEKGHKWRLGTEGPRGEEEGKDIER